MPPAVQIPPLRNHHDRAAEQDRLGITAAREASDVSGLIRSLASPKAEVRENAVYELYGNIWHQGTVDKATPYAVPFLIELLEQTSLQRLVFVRLKRGGQMSVPCRLVLTIGADR